MPANTALSGRKRQRDETGPACKLVFVSEAFEEPVEISIPHSFRVQLSNKYKRLRLAPKPFASPAEAAEDSSLAASLIHVRTARGAHVAPARRKRLTQGLCGTATEQDCA